MSVIGGPIKTGIGAALSKSPVTATATKATATATKATATKAAATKATATTRTARTIGSKQQLTGRSKLQPALSKLTGASKLASKRVTLINPLDVSMKPLDVLQERIQRKARRRKCVILCCVAFILIILISVAAISVYTVFSIRTVMVKPHRVITVKERKNLIPLPYTTDHLKGHLEARHMFHLEGYAIPEEPFNVIFLTDNETGDANAPWKMTITDDAGFIVVSDRWGGEWGEQLYILDGREVDLRIRTAESQYEIFYNRKRIDTVDSRGSMRLTNFVRISGSIQLTSAKFHQTLYEMNQKYNINETKMNNSYVWVSGRFILPCGVFYVSFYNRADLRIFQLMVSLKSNTFTAKREEIVNVNQKRWTGEMSSLSHQFNIRPDRVFNIKIINSLRKYDIRCDDTLIMEYDQIESFRTAYQMGVDATDSSLDLHWIKFIS